MFTLKKCTHSFQKFLSPLPIEALSKTHFFGSSTSNSKFAFPYYRSSGILPSLAIRKAIPGIVLSSIYSLTIQCTNLPAAGVYKPVLLCSGDCCFIPSFWNSVFRFHKKTNPASFLAGFVLVVTAEGLEPPTLRAEIWYSIQLNYAASMSKKIFKERFGLSWIV